LAALEVLKAWSAKPIDASWTIACVLGNGAGHDRRQLSIAAVNSRESFNWTRTGRLLPGLLPSGGEVPGNLIVALLMAS
jgi:hypothetical protein